MILIGRGIWNLIAKAHQFIKSFINNTDRYIATMKLDASEKHIEKKLHRHRPRRDALRAIKKHTKSHVSHSWKLLVQRLIRETAQNVKLDRFTSSRNYDLNKIPTLEKKPNHIGIIMDGNGRWGKEQIGDRSYGHKNAKNAVAEAIKGCSEQDIPYLTLYAFSTENWDRPEEEINTIFEVIAEGVTQYIDLFTALNIKVCVVGDKKKIPSFCANKLSEVEDLTQNNTKLQLNLAVNYGGKAEAIAASEAIVKDTLDNFFDEFESKGFNNNSPFESLRNFLRDYRIKITPTTYKQYLSTGHLPDVDLVIRTGGKKRLSNFLLWHCAYSELCFKDLYWPDLKKEHLMEALVFFQGQQRNFGGISFPVPDPCCK